MEVATRKLCAVLHAVRGCHRPGTSYVSQKAAFADNTAGNTPPAPPLRRPGKVAEEGKEEVEPYVT